MTPLVTLAVTLASVVASIQAYFRVKEDPLGKSEYDEGEEIKDQDEVELDLMLGMIGGKDGVKEAEESVKVEEESAPKVNIAGEVVDRD